MDKIGETLEKTRKLKGLTLREVEDATKIRIKYLDALEGEDFKALPGRVYVIGFLRTYAKFLGLDDEKLVAQFKEQSEVRQPAEENPAENRPTVKRTAHGKPGRTKTLILILLVIGLAVSGIYFIGIQGGTPPEQPVPAPDTQNSGGNDDGTTVNPAPETPPDTVVPAPEEPAAQGVAVTVEIREASCWLDVTIDGKNNFRGTLNNGDSRIFNGSQSIRIKFGNAGAAAVVFQGQTIYPVGAVGQVMTKEFSAVQMP